MNCPPASDAFGFYTGNSMLGTFVPGDKLENREYPFDAMTPGDVILFVRDGRKIVHRIVGGDPETGWLTRGDHNFSDDAWLVTSADLPHLVVARIDAQGKRFPVLNGKAGLRHHRNVQRVLKSRRKLSALWPQWFRHAPLRFLLPHRNFSTARFADLTVLYWGKKEIARKKDGQEWFFARWWMRLFFPLPEK